MTNAVIGWVIGALVIGGIGGYLISKKAPAPAPQANNTTNNMMSESMMTQSQPLPQNATDDQKIQNALSAAPEAISKDATVLDWPAKEGEDFRTLRKGTSVWTCVPDYPASPGNDPFCGDQNSFQWFGAYMQKKTPAIAQAGIGYMLQGGSDPSNTDPFATEPKAGESWISAPAHIMIFPTGKLDSKVYGTDPMSGKPWIMWADTPYAHLMIPVKQ